MRPILTLIVLVLIAVGGYAGYWFLAAERIRAAAEDWTVAREAQGWVITNESLSISGFPRAHRVVLSGLDIAAPPAQGDWSLAAAHLEIEAAAPWNFQSWTARPHSDVRLRLTSGEEVLLAATAGHLMLDFADGAIRRFYAEAHELSILSLTAPLRAARAAFMQGERGNEGWRVQFEARDAQAAEGAFADARAAFGSDIRLLALDLQADEEGLAALAAGGAGLDEAGELTVNAARLEWGVAELSGAGALGVDGAGRMRGAFDVAVNDPAAFLGALAGASVLDTQQANIALAAVAFLPRDDTDRTILPFSFRNGETLLGPVPVGLAPRLRAESRAAPAQPASPEPETPDAETPARD